MKSSTPSCNLQKIILENVSDIIITTDLAFIVESWNHIAEHVYCVPATDAIGRRLGELVNFTFHGTTIEQAFQDLATNKIWRGEVSYTNKHGETFHFLQTVKYTPDEEGKESGILAVGRDITERKRAEEQLQQSEKFYRSLIADSLDVTMLMNGNGDISFATPSIERVLGYAPEEILNTNAFQYIHPDDLEWTKESFAKEVEENPEIKFIVVRVRKKTGEWLWCMARGHNLLNNPYINAIAVFLHDDT
ncbi:MAG: PAS domain S-box protein, partial [Chitinophagaceae bacterium]